MPSISEWCIFTNSAKRPPFQPFDQGAFPRRAAQVQRLALQAPDQLAQFALAARPGQRGMAHVVFEVDLVVLDPFGHRVQVEGDFRRRFHGALKLR